MITVAAILTILKLYSPINEMPNDRDEDDEDDNDGVKRMNEWIEVIIVN